MLYIFFLSWTKGSTLESTHIYSVLTLCVNNEC